MKIACTTTLLRNRLTIRGILDLPAPLRYFAFASTSGSITTTTAYRIKRAAGIHTRSNGCGRRMSSGGKDGDQKGPPIPRPSSSVLLISPDNQVLLLQRVKQSSSFASAHVFPGGNVSGRHDGELPSKKEEEEDSAARHVDSDVYRMAAIRETFEESGILLARNNGFGRLIEVPEEEREEGRKLVHSDQVPFPQWLARKGGRADLREFLNIS